MSHSFVYASMRAALIAGFVLLAAGCGGDGSPTCPGAPVLEPGELPDPDLAYPPVGSRPDPTTLDLWNLFEDEADQAPKEDVIPYGVSSPLFTDYAAKHRFIYVPPGAGCEIDYDDTEKWGFPVGSVLIKTFAYPVDERSPELGEQLIETRLLINEGTAGWRALTYQWNEAGTVATLERNGAFVDVTYTDASGAEINIPMYTIPSQEQCQECHEVSGGISPIGPATPQLNIAHTYDAVEWNQVDYLHDLGLFDRAPAALADRLTLPDPFEVGGLNSPSEKARSYMHANCSHCHSRTGPVEDKTLYLDYASTDPDGDTPAFNWGVCKPPTSAGNSIECEGFSVDVDPGHPEDSLLACRVETTAAGLMPPVGRTEQHTEGLALIEAWITDLDEPSCD